MKQHFPNIKYRDMVRSLDENLAGTDPAFNIAVVLLSILQVGPYVGAIADEADLPPHVVSGVLRRAKAEGIIKGKKINSNWADPKDGGISFWLDVATVEGFLHRTAA